VVAGRWWFILVILANQEAEIRRTEVQGKPITRKGLVEWVKV
jgi:hypothetical protein